MHGPTQRTRTSGTGQRTIPTPFSQSATADFNIFYVCLRKWDAAGEDCCNSAIPAFNWDTLHQDLLANTQRWYCPLCNKRYTTNYGVILEILDTSNKDSQQALYARAEFPPNDIKDLKALCVERVLNKCETPEELLKSLPILMPAARETVFREVQKKGVFHFSNEVRKNLPVLEWYQLYNLVKGYDELPKP